MFGMYFNENTNTLHRWPEKKKLTILYTRDIII